MNFTLAKSSFIMNNSGMNASITSASLKTCVLEQPALLCCTNETKTCKGCKWLHTCSNTNGNCTTTSAWMAKPDHSTTDTIPSSPTAIQLPISLSLKHCVLSKVTGHLIRYALLCTHTAGESKTWINVFLYNSDNLWWNIISKNICTE